MNFKGGGKLERRGGALRSLFGMRRSDSRIAIASVRCPGVFDFNTDNPIVLIEIQDDTLRHLFGLDTFRIH